MKILVLGGTGAMGTELVKQAAEEGNDVYVTSRSYRGSDFNNVHYICGNGIDNSFIQEILHENHYDAIVDFMSYTTDIFKNRFQLFLEHTNQYVYLSSSRVYADSLILTEKSSRLLETCKDAKYLETDEYALAKARQEDLLVKSGRMNWTIIRPYITYNINRMQLGFLEKEQWLYRALNGKPIAVSTDILERETTVTFGGDVAKCIYSIIGRSDAIGEIFQIASDFHLKWKDVLKTYCDVITDETGNRPQVIAEESYEKIAKVVGREFQAEYDRLYNRVFDSAKIKRICGDGFHFTLPEEGLRYCLQFFISNKITIRNPDWRYEGYSDKLSRMSTPLLSVPGLKNKFRYLLARYTHYYEMRVRSS